MKSPILALAVVAWAGFAGSPDVYNKRGINTPEMAAKTSGSRTAAEILLTLDAQPFSAAMLDRTIEALKREPNDPELNLSVGFGLLSQALLSDIKFFGKATRHFQKAASKYPDDPYLLMYLGLAMGAQALDTEPSVLSRIKWAREGFKNMDRAVKLMPNNYLFRLLRGDAELKAHPIFRRNELMETDSRFVQDFMQTAEFAVLKPHQKARFHLFMANYYSKKKQPQKEVEAHLFQAVQLGKGTSVAAEAQARLEGRWSDLGFES